MIARRWSAQDTYAAEIEEAAATYAIPRELAYGLVAQESGFKAAAYRAEPNYQCAATGKIGDASYGLTQVLYCTALGLGYSGPPAGLWDPRTNLALGFRYLGDLLRARETTAAALSNYNGGYRPSLGYGAPRADGTFTNQQYVNGVLEKAAYFAGYLAERDPSSVPSSPGSSSPTPSTAGGGLFGWILGGGLIAALLSRLRLRSSRR
jgi:soluble lytic murein transglycosylase-like protein